MAKRGKKKVSGVAIWLVRALAVVGFILMVDLARIHYASLGSGSVCELGAGFSCEEVNTSEYSEVLGIPVSLMGLGFFAAVFLASLTRNKEQFFKWVVWGTLLVLPVSFYLTGLELLVIKSICVFCEASKVLMVLILGVGWWELRKRKKMVSGESLAIVVGIGLVGMAATWFLQKSAASSGPVVGYPNLAACMSDNGVIMYGSKRCSVCARVRAMFGESFESVNEIECHPREEGAQTALCLEKKITKTPTFVREVEGAEQRIVGFAEPEELAEFSGCEEALEKDLSLPPFEG